MHSTIPGASNYGPENNNYRSHSCYQYDDCKKTSDNPPPQIPRRGKQTVRKKTYRCGECDREFKRLDGLNRHIKTFSGEKLDPCGTCGKTFSLRCARHLHRLIHPRAFKCDICGRTFRRHVQLSNHLHLHSVSTGRRHKCDICGMSFEQERFMKIHKARHAGLLFGCAKCGETFDQLMNLKNHELTHSEEMRPRRFW